MAKETPRFPTTHRALTGEWVAYDECELDQRCVLVARHRPLDLE